MQICTSWAFLVCALVNVSHFPTRSRSTSLTFPNMRWRNLMFEAKTCLKRKRRNVFNQLKKNRNEMVRNLCNALLAALCIAESRNFSWCLQKQVRWAGKTNIASRYTTIEHQFVFNRLMLRIFSCTVCMRIMRCASKRNNFERGNSAEREVGDSRGSVK